MPCIGAQDRDLALGQFVAQDAPRAAGSGEVDGARTSTVTPSALGEALRQ